MKIRVQQLNPTIGDIEGNKALILEALREAEEAHVDLLMLNEMSVCGYPALDLLERRAFLDAVEKANHAIVSQTQHTALLFGSLCQNTERPGRPAFNIGILAHHGQQVAEVRKTLLPTYDVFDEGRYFEPNRLCECVEWNGARLGITICEDIWANNSLVQYHTYPVEPVKILAKQGADVILNISASPFTVHKAEERIRMLRGNAQKYSLPVFYANQVGGNTELISDGDSLVLDSRGEIVTRAPLFDDAYRDVDWEPGKEPVAKAESIIVHPPVKEERIFRALIKGLRDYLSKSGAASKVLLGLSGGIDSAVAACIATEALGPENVTGFLMPSEFSTVGSVRDAEALAENLGIMYHQLPIRDLYEQYLHTLAPLFKDTEFGVAEENLQSRTRGVLLMAVSNKFGGMVLNTGNKSELATGYCTLYGDMNGGLSVLGDLYKTEVFALAEWLNNLYFDAQVIPQEILTKPPSAELRPDQLDTDSLPGYEILDQILKLYIEKQYSVDQITNQGFDRTLVSGLVRRIEQNEHKRSQAPPALKIHSKSFGPGRRRPLAQKWTSHTLVKRVDN